MLNSTNINIEKTTLESISSCHRDSNYFFKKIQLAQKYGPVFSLQMGGTLFVFVHGFPLVKEVLVTKGMEFAGRPSNPVIEVITKRKGIR